MNEVELTEPPTMAGMRFGESLVDDVRCQQKLRREDFFLRVLIPRQPTLLSTMRACWTSASVLRQAFVLVCLIVYITMVAVCSGEHIDGPLGSFCAGGPLNDDGNEIPGFTFVSYRPAILNGMTTLLVAFYCNIALGYYMETYYACQQLNSRVQQLMSLAAGTITDRAVLCDIWRSANIVHLCAYHLGDKSKQVYGFEDFVVAVGEAFGPWDEARHVRGMWRGAELDHLREVSVGGIAGGFNVEAHAHALRVEHQSSVRDLIDHVHVRGGAEQPAFAASSPRAAVARRRLHDEEGGGEGDGEGFGEGGGAVGGERGGATTQTRRQQQQPGSTASHSVDSFTNARGNVKSAGALTSQLFTVRLYRLVQRALQLQLSTAAWPVWGASLSKFQESVALVQSRGLYRLPTLYRYSVQSILKLTLVYDTLIVGAEVRGSA